MLLGSWHSVPNTRKCALMKSSLQYKWEWLTADERRFAVLVSFILSIWIILTNDTVNTDGVLYVDTAYHIKNWNISAASELYHWNFYPALIALTSKITFLNLESSAFLLNSIFIAGTIWFFLSILKLMGANRATMIAGLTIILIHPYINEYRADIIRGPGFWFFFMWGTYLLIKANETAEYRYAFFYSLVICIGTLFRIEGAAFLLFGPLIFWYDHNHTASKRALLMISAYLIPISAGIILFFVWLIVDNNLPLGRLLEPSRLIADSYNSLVRDIPQKGNVISSQVLNQKSEDFGHVGVYSILIAILLLTTIKRVTLLVFILSAYSLLKDKIRHSPTIIWLSFINLSYMFLYLIYHFFLSSRFAMPTALLMALPASFALSRLFQKVDKTEWKLRTARAMVAILLLFMLLDGLISTGTSKYYIREAGYWLKENTSQDETILTNMLHVKYYANIRMDLNKRKEVIWFGKQLNKSVIDYKAISSADYIAIHTRKIKPHVIQKIEQAVGRKPIKVFSSSDKERLLIYQKQ